MLINNSFDYTDNRPNLIEKTTYDKLIEVQTHSLPWNKKLFNNIKMLFIENVGIIILFIIIIILLILRYFYVRNKKKKYDIIYGKN
jgi:hypothetical protein